MFHVVNLAVGNAWLECRRDTNKRSFSKKLDMLSFSLSVIEALTAAGSKPVAPKRGRPSLSPLQVSKHPRMAENHLVQDVRFDQLGHFPLHNETNMQDGRLHWKNAHYVREMQSSPIYNKVTKLLQVFLYACITSLFHSCYHFHHTELSYVLLKKCHIFHLVTIEL